jgi:exopolysaccharide production protein ExoQ
MRIAKARLVSPDRNFWYGLVAVAVSIFVFAYSTLFGQISVLAYYAFWLPLVLVDYRHTLGNYPKFYWIVAFAMFACLSVFWSAAPAVTARASLQLASHLVCALIAARTIGIRTLTLGMLIGVMVVLCYSLAFGDYRYDPLDGSYSFIGAFASKNQLGLFASLGLYFAFADIFILRERGPWRVLAVVCGGLSGYALHASQSAASVIATAVTLTAITGLAAILLFSPRIRKVGLLVATIFAATIVLVGLNAGGLDLLLGAFGKDATLTGRTYLWATGFEAAAQTPVLGVGYQAYWVQGFPEAERLWQEFYITARSGFHFHNTYIEGLVELGAIGVVLLALVLVRVLLGHLARLLNDSRDQTAYIMLGIALMLLIRSFVEVDLLQPYVVGSFLLYYAAGLLALPQDLRVAAGRARPRAAQLQATI